MVMLTHEQEIQNPFQELERTSLTQFPSTTKQVILMKT